jgi:serine/threonine protein kinase
MSHEHIVGLLGASWVGDDIYMFLEYCEGGTLEDHLKERLLN